MSNEFHQVISTHDIDAPAKPVVIPVDLRRRAINARFELAERSADLNEQFARATSSSGRTALDPESRRTIKDRVRHEMHEANPWLKGSARTTVTWVIGRGPWLEVNIPGNPDASRMIADKFNHWFRKRVRGPRKFRAMCWGKQADGSGLAMVITDETVRGKVKLNFVPFEDDHIRLNPSRQNIADRATYLLDGKEFDAAGNETVYHISANHPAEDPMSEPMPVSAQYVIDVWDYERPSQGRGVSPYSTSAKNGPLMRAYRRATLDAATTAAKLSFLLRTNLDRFDNGEELFQDIETFLGVPINYGEGMALPKGWDPIQLRPEHPTTGHDEFLRSNISEMGRAAGQPGQVALGDAKGLNFASGQLGRQDWEVDVDVQRQDWEDLALDKLLEHWLIEAALVGEIPREFADLELVPHEYRWSRRRHQDTSREYSGRNRAIQSGLTSRQFWQTDDGMNPDAEDEAAAKGFGVDVQTYRRALFFTYFGESAQRAIGETDDELDEEDSEVDSEEDPTERNSGNGD